MAKDSNWDIFATIFPTIVEPKPRQGNQCFVFMPIPSSPEMCSSSFPYQALKDTEWFQIPGANFVIKYNFVEDGYSIIVSDLKNIFGENLEEMDIQSRFSNCNPHAEMKTKVILKNLKHSLESILADKQSVTEVDCSEEALNIQLQFNVNQVSFIFNLKPTLLSSQEFQAHVIVPTLYHALLTHQENVALKKKVKDLEDKLNSTVSPQKPLLDYKMNSNAFNLFDTVSETAILDAFLEMQSGMKDQIPERNKLLALHRNHFLQASNEKQPKASNASVKREIAELLEPKSEIKYDDAEEGNSETTNSQVSQSTHSQKVKKKKSLKF